MSRDSRPRPARGRQLWVALGAAGMTIALAACGTSVASSTTSPSSTPSKKKSTASSSASAPATPTYTRKPSPSPSPTKVAPIFVASLPSVVSAIVGQRIVVQLATEPDEKWSASSSGGVVVSGTAYSAPPEDQPDAPGTSITTVTAKSAGTGTVTFTLSSTAGAASSAKKLVIKVK